MGYRDHKGGTWNQRGGIWDQTGGIWDHSTGIRDHSLGIRDHKPGSGLTIFVEPGIRLYHFCGIREQKFSTLFLESRIKNWVQNRVK